MLAGSADVRESVRSVQESIVSSSSSEKSDNALDREVAEVTRALSLCFSFDLSSSDGIVSDDIIPESLLTPDEFRSLFPYDLSFIRLRDFFSFLYCLISFTIEFNSSRLGSSVLSHSF